MDIRGRRVVKVKGRGLGSGGMGGCVGRGSDRVYELAFKMITK